MSYSVCAYLTEADKVKSVYGTCDNQLINQLKVALKQELDTLNDYFSDSLNTDKDAYAALADIVNGEIRYPEIAFMYGDYDYEQEIDDLNFIFDEAVEAQKDLVIMVY